MSELKKQVLVIGGGPAGYSAAFRSADLGMDTVLVEKNATLGGVCLNVGCIPSKALLHIASIIDESESLHLAGIQFGKPNIDLDKVREWKSRTIATLTGGLASMAKARKVRVIKGEALFTDPHHVSITGSDDISSIEFEHAIIAAGSTPVKLPFIPHDDHRVWDSTDALNLDRIPEKMLVVGGGIIGLEMATVYTAFGSSVDVVELSKQLVPPADKDLSIMYTRSAKKKFGVMTSTKVSRMEARDDGLLVTFEGEQVPEGAKLYDTALIAVGRVPNGKSLQAEKAGVRVSDSGFIEVDNQQRTNVDHIYGIGDIVGQPMLAHKGTHQGHVAADVIAGKKIYFEPLSIPNIAYTNPEIAWVGHSEKSAKAAGIQYEKAKFPWAASGRALASNAADGFTKLLLDKESGRVIGGAVVGKHGSEILGEIGLAVEMEANAEDLSLTVHAHPTLYESIGLSAEVFEGVITDLPNKKAEN